MVTRELIQAEIEHLNGDELVELYDFMKRLTQSKRKAKSKKSLMDKLAGIKINAPEDFSVNHDLYATGERRAQTHSD